MRALPSPTNQFRRLPLGTQRRQLLLNALKLFDLGVMVLSFGVATWAVSQESPTSLAEFFAMRVKIGNFLIFCGLLLVWYFLFPLFGMYASRRLSRRREEIIDIVKLTSTATLAILLAAALFRIRMVREVFLPTFWIASTSCLIAGRLLMRAVLKRVRQHGRNLRDVLIVGTNSRALRFARKIESSTELGYRIIGFIDDTWAGIDELTKSGFHLVCAFSEAPAFLRKNVVDEVIVALPMGSMHTQASRIAELCAEQGIMLRFLPNVLELKTTRSRTEELAGHSVVTHYTGALQGWALVVKRVLDIVFSLSLIILLAPVLVITVALIKLTSPGPVFFLQNRLGLNKRRFFVYKFRTMVPDAEKRMKEIEHLNEVSGPVFKIKNDPRVTPLGRFLRKTSIDELPQLFNVLKGDMSLVGPRPLPVRDYEGFSQDWQRRRFSVRPGITCLWQVNGRSSIAFEKWMELDLEYIDKWSLWLDFEILVRTVPAVLKGSGAA